jgi:hypothetical protein
VADDDPLKARAVMVRWIGNLGTAPRQLSLDLGNGALGMFDPSIEPQTPVAQHLGGVVDMREGG